MGICRRGEMAWCFIRLGIFLQFVNLAADLEARVGDGNGDSGGEGLNIIFCCRRVVFSVTAGICSPAGTHVVSFDLPSLA